MRSEMKSRSFFEPLSIAVKVIPMTPPMPGCSYFVGSHFPSGSFIEKSVPDE